MAIHDPPPPSDIFLAHHGRQNRFVKDLHDRLSSLTYSVFLDQDVDSLPLVQNFDQNVDLLPLEQDCRRRILSEAHACRLTVLVLSDAFLMSKWPMIELNAFAARHGSATDSEFTILPLFLELLPGDLKDEKKLNTWREKWLTFAGEADGHIDVAVCEKIVTEVLPSINGIVRRSPKKEDEISYINDIVEGIKRILVPRNVERFPYGSDRYISGKKYVGEERLRKVILKKFHDLDGEIPAKSAAMLRFGGNNEAEGSSFSISSASSSVVAKVSIVGMYGLPGSGKTTVCDFLRSENVRRNNGLLDDPFFRGEVVYFKFPTWLNDGTDYFLRDKEKSEFAELFSKIVPDNSTVPSMDPDKTYSHHFSDSVPSRRAQKMFLMFDNISVSNSPVCMTRLKGILASLRLSSGSRVTLVSRSKSLLKGLLDELAEQYPHHGYALMEVPCLSEAEAKDMIRNRCPSLKEEILPAFLNKSYFRSYSSKSMYIPLVFEQIGNYLSVASHSDELEHLWKKLNMAKKGSLNELLQMNFDRLEKHLKDLFFDIALFIIPAGYSKLYDQAIPILSRMHNKTDVDIKMQIEDLEKQSWLSIIDDVKHGPQLRVHDIYVDFAWSIPGNVARYVNERSSLARITEDSARRPLSMVDHSHAKKTRDQQVPDDRYAFRRSPKYLDARTIHIGVAPAAYGGGMRFLHLQLGSSAKAVIVRNHFPNHYSKCVLALSGNLSTLVCLELQNVWQVAISPSDYEGALDLSNLTRLALRNDNAKEIQIDTFTGQSGPMELINNAVHFIANGPEKGTQSVQRVWNPLLIRNLMAGATEMTGLRELILVNTGITKLDGIGHLCPQLEALEFWNDFEHEKEMSVSIIGGAPKLKRLAAGPFPPKCSLEDGAFDLFVKLALFRQRGRYNAQANAPNRSSSKLILELDKCPELKQICVNGSFFGHVQMAGGLPASVSDLVVANDRENIDYSSTMPISSYFQTLTHLEMIELSCTKVERLEVRDKTQCLLPKLKQLLIQGCTRLCYISLSLNSLPMLRRLTVRRCHELEKLELVDEVHLTASTSCRTSLRCLELIDLPKLKSDGPLLWSSPGIGLTLVAVTVFKCPLFKIDSGILEASKIVELVETCMPTLQLVHDQSSPTCAESASSLVPVNVNQFTFENNRFQRLRFLTVANVTQLEEIEGIEHLPTLYEVILLSLPDLIRVGGKSWPESVGEIWVSHCAKLERIPLVKETAKFTRLRCNECKELKEVKVEGKVRNVEFMGCSSMEAFPLEYAMEELKKRRKEYPYIFAGMCRVRVTGSKFAGQGKERWLEESEFGSPLFEAAVEALMWDIRPSSTDKKHVHVDIILSKIVSTFPTTITHNDLHYLAELFSSEHSDPLLTVGEPSLLLGFPNEDKRFFQEWLLSKFPQLYNRDPCFSRNLDMMTDFFTKLMTKLQLVRPSS